MIYIRQRIPPLHMTGAAYTRVFMARRTAECFFRIEMSVSAYVNTYVSVIIL